MAKSMNYLLVLISLTVFTMPLFSQKNGASKASRHAAEEIITVGYCDLIRHPELYVQKLVRVQAVYRYGYEWSELYCPDCLTKVRTWLDFDESFETCTRSEVAKKIADNGFIGRTVSVVLVGRFYGSGGGYGHMGAYKSKFLVSCVEKAKIIRNDSVLPGNALPKKLLDQMTCHTPSVEKK